MARLSVGRWHSLGDRLGVTLDEGCYHEILARYAESWRAYHNVLHIGDCLDQLDRSLQNSARPEEVEFALWLHDAIYDTQRTDNEQRSARYAERILRQAGCSADVIHRVGGNIAATAHVAITDGVDEQLTADIDLSILGRSTQEFERYEASIRKEYEWVARPIYCRKRIEVLRTFLSRERIYSTPWYAERYESRARLNLNAAVERLAKDVEA